MMAPAQAVETALDSYADQRSERNRRQVVSALADCIRVEQVARTAAVAVFLNRRTHTK